MMSNVGKVRSKTFEFLTLFLMVIGTVVGAGIYLKNTEILEQTQNPIIAILLWLIVGVVCLFAIVAFFEISSSTKNSGNGTIGNWLKLFVNRKTASFFAVFYVIFYVPAYNALFVGMSIYFFLQLLGINLSWQTMLIIYLLVGIFLLISSYLINTLSAEAGRIIQIFGTFFKFLPLLVAFISGFILIPKDPPGAIFNPTVDPTHPWSVNNWNPVLFFRGFGGVLLAFDGFIYLANQQKNYHHKDVVPKAIFFGMLFATIFYVLMAISLFLGSPDGSVVKLFEKLFQAKPWVANFVSNFLLMLICLLNINLFVMIGVKNIQSDLDAKLLYMGARRGKVSNFKSGIVQGLIASVVYIVFIIMGFFLATSDGLNSINNIAGSGAELPVKYINIMSSIAGIVSFSLMDLLIISALVNRKTKKVMVDPVKNMAWCSWIAIIFITIFVISGLYSFLDPNLGNYQETPWVQTTGFYFLILFLSFILVSVVCYLVQEQLFKIHPFEDGFDGYLEGVDLHPWTFRFNWKENYFNQKKFNNEVKYKKKSKKRA